MVIDVQIPGPAVPWQRTATSEGRRLTPAKQRAYQRHVKACLATGVITHGGRWPIRARYTVTIEYVPQDARRRDIDNIAKTILDAANGVVWDDDSQVDVLVVRRHKPRSRPGVGVHVEVLGDEDQRPAEHAVPMRRVRRGDARRTGMGARPADPAEVGAGAAPVPSVRGRAGDGGEPARAHRRRRTSRTPRGERGATCAPRGDDGAARR